MTHLGQKIHQSVFLKLEKINKVLHLAFGTKDFEGYLKYLNEQGIKYFNFNEEQNKIQIRPDGVRQIYFQDPDRY